MPQSVTSGVLTKNEIVVGLAVLRTGARAGGGVTGTGLRGSVHNRDRLGGGSPWGLGGDLVRDDHGEPRFLPVSAIPASAIGNNN